MDTGIAARQRNGGGRALIALPPPFIHPSALIEEAVSIGDGTSVWDNVHIRHSSVIGQECMIGEKTHISYSVRIGNRVKINAFVYVCTAVTIEDGVMLAAGTIFTNDRFPRATTPDLSRPRSSAPDDHTFATLVKAGATTGAGCVIGCGFSIGRWAMIGMGAVVTKAVPDFTLVIGNPARPVAYVCRCGEPFARFEPGGSADVPLATCVFCGGRYSAQAGVVMEIA